MKISPIASPAAIPPQGTPEVARTARAVAAFNNAGKAASPEVQQQQAHNVDQNNISAEELSAIVPQIQEEAPQEEVIAPQEEVQEPAKPEVDEGVKRQFAQLARQEKALRAKAQQQDKAFKEREAQLAAREAAIKPQDLSDYARLSDLRRDPLALLEKAGVTYDQLTEQLLNPAPKNPQYEAKIDDMQAKIDALMERLEAGTKSQAESQQQQYQAAVNQITLDAKALVKANPIEFEAIAKTNSVRDVVELIEQTYAKDGIVLSVEEAAQEVENYLVEESFSTVSRIDKIKKRLAQNTASSAKTDVKQQAPQQKPQMKTLTNASSSSRQLSAKERAILAFKGELKG
jgi:hypothetical protein